MRIESISLDLCIGNKASLVWVGQDHFFHRLKFLELIVDQTPIPACFNDGFAWPFQTGKKLRKPSCAIAFDSSLAQLPPALIQRAQHAVLLVDIYSDVVHENSFLSSSSLRTGMLLSCYLNLKPTKKLVIKVEKKDENGSSSNTSENFVAEKDGKFVIPVPGPC